MKRIETVEVSSGTRNGMTLNDGAQLPQIIEGFRDTGPLRLGFGGDEILFRVLDAAVERGQVEVLERNGFLGEHDDLLGVDLGKTAAYEDAQIRRLAPF